MSTAGTEFSSLAISTIAVLQLSATSIEASALYAAGFLSGALTAPAAGAILDRVARPVRTIIGVELLHVVVLAAIPVAVMADALGLWLVLGVAVLSGCLGALARVGAQAMVREVVRDNNELVQTNSAVTGGSSLARMIVPTGAGWAVQALGPAVAVVVDAVSYLISAFALSRLRAIRRTRPIDGARSSFGEDIRGGLAVIRDNSALFRIMLMSATLNLGGAGIGGLYYLYAYRVLNLNPLQVGITAAVHSAAAVVGALAAGRIAMRLGLERVIPTFAPVAAASLLLIPTAVWAPVPVLIAYEAAFGFCASVWTISATTLQQQVAPPGMVAKVVGLSQAAATIVIPVGALVGGFLALHVGILPTLILFASITLAGTILVSPRWGLWQSRISAS